MWLHSAAAPLAPVSTRPSIDDAAAHARAQRRAEHDVEAAAALGRPARAAAPSMASDSTKQLASLSTRTGRPSAAAQVAIERPIVQAREVRVQDAPGLGLQEPGRADADAAACAGRVSASSRFATAPRNVA